MVHLSPIKRVRLLPRASIAISILAFGTFIGIMSSLGTLETRDLTQISLGWGRWGGTVLAVASSIPITILVAIMVVRATSSMGVLKLKSRFRGKTGLLLGSRVILPLSILPLTVFNLLLLSFNHDGTIYQLLVVVETCYHQFHA